MKAIGRKTFGKNVSQLITSGDILNLKILLENTLMNEVIINLRVLGASMKNWIGHDGQGKNIIAPKLWGKSKKNAKILQNLTNPTELGSSGSKCPIFRLCGRRRHSVLLFSTPSDGVVTKVGNIPSRGMTIKGVTYSI